MKLAIQRLEVGLSLYHAKDDVLGLNVGILFSVLLLLK